MGPQMMLPSPVFFEQIQESIRSRVAEEVQEKDSENEEDQKLILETTEIGDGFVQAVKRLEKDINEHTEKPSRVLVLQYHDRKTNLSLLLLGLINPVVGLVAYANAKQDGLYHRCGT